MIEKPTLALFPSYLKTIENSVGSPLFRNLYFRINNEMVDALDDGDLSCAVFVTSILYLCGLIKGRHTTVKSTLKDMQEFGWYEMKEPRKGALVLWDYMRNEDGTRGTHQHVGFYIDSETAVSNDSTTRVVARHHLTFGTLSNGNARRSILAYYWNDKLN